MYFSDSHTHSICSHDGSATMLEMAQGAIAAGLDELTITDHCDLLGEQGGLQLEYDWRPARDSYAQARQALGDSFLLKRGIEIGGVPGYEAYADRILQEPLDFVVGSVHNYTKEQHLDFYFYRYQDNLDMCRAHLDNYMDSLEATVRWGGFDTLGHIPYPLRYMRDRDGNQISLAPYEERIRALLRQLIHQGKALELNTCRGRSVEDYRELFTWYHEAGGELLTISSDAHRPQDIGKGVPQAQELLRQVGFRYFATYTGRQPEFHAL